jgi:glutamine synthetase
VPANLQEVGLRRARHHEVGTAGQQEINYEVRHAAARGRRHDEVQVRHQEHRAGNGKTATFMPKPIFGDNGSGMHTHQSLWKDGKPLFYDEPATRGLSDLARWYIGGMLHHAPSLLAFTNPTVNSYHRLVPGYEAPVNLVYSSATAPPASASRSPATPRRPSASSSALPGPSATRTWRSPPMLMAGLDGIKNKIEPPSRSTRTSTSCPRTSTPNIPQVPGSLARCSTRSRPTTSTSRG